VQGDRVEGEVGEKGVDDEGYDHTLNGIASGAK
jgi:hypothetical protein